MLDAELAEIVANLRVLGTDIADVEVKNCHGGSPSHSAKRCQHSPTLAAES